MSSTLFLIREDQQFFSREEFIDILKQIPGIFDIRPDNGVILDSIIAEYAHGAQRNIVRLKNPQRTIVIDSVDSVSACLAYQIQQLYKHSLRMFDEGYNFDIIISDRSLEELTAIVLSE